MRAPVMVAVGVGSLAIVAIAALVFDLSFERAALLAPAIVICVGAAVGLVVIWAKAALEPLRRRQSRDRQSTASK